MRRDGSASGAASGLGAILTGAAAVLFERGPVSASDPVAKIVAYYTDNQAALRAQALLFVVGAGFFLWFLGSLRSFLSRPKAAAAGCRTLAMGAGVASTVGHARGTRLPGRPGQRRAGCRPAGAHRDHGCLVRGREPAARGDAHRGRRRSPSGRPSSRPGSDGSRSWPLSPSSSRCAGSSSTAGRWPPTGG